MYRIGASRGSRVAAAAAAPTAAALLLWWTTATTNSSSSSSSSSDQEEEEDLNRIATTTTTTTTMHTNSINRPLFSAGVSTRNITNNNTTSYCEACEGASSSASSSNSSSRTRLEDLKDSEDTLLQKRFSLAPGSRLLGEGAFAKVKLAKDETTGETVAVKSINRAYTDRHTFQREMRAMQYILQFGGHPHICALHTYFEDEDNFNVVMDYISGGEMFDHLIKNGAYSESDAARLVREVASALAFLHGIGVVHADLKPENLMLSCESASDSIVKLVDFGCTQIPGGDNYRSNTAFTPAYAPPETFKKKETLEAFEPPMDMWALGVILYIMLVGLHPFVLTSKLTDAELEERIVSGKPPPIRDSPMTAHLSNDAIELLERLIESDPSKRMTAQEMLAHPWVNGTTAPTDAITGSDERLSRIRKMKTRLQANFLQDVVNWSDNENSLRRQTSLMDQSFKTMYTKSGGILPLLTDEVAAPADDDDNDHGEGSSISMAEFRSLLAENMKHKFFPRNHIVYNEGDIGNHMYIINSGTIEVTTSNGSRAERSQGDFFGEGALLHPKSIRSGTIRCKTPVHVIEISREYFEKYLQSSELGLMLAVKEKDRIRKRNRAKMILSLQNNKMETFRKGEFLYEQGTAGDLLFMVESGNIFVSIKGNHVFTAGKGNVCGEHTLISGLKRNCTAECVTETCMVQTMTGHEFRRLMDLYPDAKDSLRDLCLRRDLKKAIVLKLEKEFPYDNPMEAFHAVGIDEDGLLRVGSIATMMRNMDPDYTKEEIDELFKVMDLTNSGTVSFEEFRKVFIADLRTSASM
jgi:serine/threonine protein kinase